MALITKDLSMISEFSMVEFSNLAHCFCGGFFRRMNAKEQALSISRNSGQPSLRMKANALIAAGVARAFSRIVLIGSWTSEAQIPLPAMKAVSIFVVNMIFGKPKQETVQRETPSPACFENALSCPRIWGAVMRAVRSAPTTLRASFNIFSVYDRKETASEGDIRNARTDDLLSLAAFRCPKSFSVFVNSGGHALTIA